MCVVEETPFVETIPVEPLSSVDLQFLCCPYADHGDLSQSTGTEIVCESCDRRFRTVGGRPILFDETRSICSSRAVAALADVRQFPRNVGWRHQIRRVFPAAASRDTGLNLLVKHVPALLDNPTVLILGCGSTKDLYVNLFPSARLFFTDVTLQGDASIACDGECLPFRDQTFDCVTVDQVLEHVVNPAGVVAEIYRCLKPNGIVYSGVPFHTPIHSFPYDFQRYTPLGHRMLFRRFQELEFSITQGPVSALSKTLIGLFASLSENIWWRRVSSFNTRLLLRPLLLMDKRYATARELTIPAASAFLGKKRSDETSSKEIISDWLDKVG